MVKVKLIVSRTDGSAGDIVEVNPEEAKRMVNVGQGVLVRSGIVEKAVKSKKFEKATK